MKKPGIAVPLLAAGSVLAISFIGVPALADKNPGGNFSEAVVECLRLPVEAI